MLLINKTFLAALTTAALISPESTNHCSSHLVQDGSINLGKQENVSVSIYTFEYFINT